MSEVAARRRTVVFSVFALAALSVPLLIWVPPDPGEFLRVLGFGADIPAFGWVAAALVCADTSRMPRSMKAPATAGAFACVDCSWFQNSGGSSSGAVLPQAWA